MDNIEFELIREHSYTYRVLFWPTNIDEEKNQTFSGGGSNNFWSMSEQCENWELKMNLNEIIQNSGDRFVNQRYGTDYSDDYWGTVNLCRFVHEEFKLQDIPAE